MSRIRLSLAVVVLAAGAGAGRAADPNPARDLPAGARIRFGGVEFRHRDGVYYLGYLPDGKSILTASKDGTVRLWDAVTGAEIRRFTDLPVMAQEAPVTQKARPLLRGIAEPDPEVVLSGDGRFLAAAAGKSVKLYEVSSGRILRTLTADHEVTRLVFPPGADSLTAVGPGGGLQTWNLQSGKGTARPADPDWSKFGSRSGPLSLTDLSGDAKVVAWGRLDEKNGGIHVRDLGAPAAHPTALASGPATVVQFSPDGRSLAWVGLDGTLHVTEVKSGTDTILRGPKNEPAGGPARSLAFSPDGRRLAVCRLVPAAEVWDLKSQSRTHRVADPVPPLAVLSPSMTLSIPNYDGAVAFSPDGDTLAFTLVGSGTVRRLDLRTGGEVKPPGDGHTAPVSAVATSTDGTVLFTFARGDLVRVWDAATGRFQRTLTTPATATRAAFSRDGGRVALIVEGEVSVRETVRGTELLGLGKKDVGVTDPVTAGVTAVALSPDGRTVAVRRRLSPDIRLFDVATGRPGHTLTQAAAPAGQGAGGAGGVVAGVTTPEVVFSPDGRYLAGGGPRWQLCVWEVSSGRVVYDLPVPSGRVYERLAFGPSALALAALGPDGSVTVHETATGRERGVFGSRTWDRGEVAAFFGGSLLHSADRSDLPASVVFSPNGRLLAATRGGAIRVWDLTTGLDLGPLAGDLGGTVSLLWTPNGRELLAGGGDGTVLAWPIKLRQPNDPEPELTQKEFETLWADLSAEDPGRARTAVQRLGRSPSQAIAQLKARLAPVPQPPAEQVTQLVSDLASDRLTVRRAAETELGRLGPVAEPEIRRALAAEPPIELRQRLERALERAAKLDAEQLRGLRAVEFLDAAGGVDAHAVLKALARGAPMAPVTRASAAALAR